ncbi:microtubule-associated protein tau isoform X2 [Leguminivora glycinivorella]|uniref:microtubule-associated protein tau isoform X2 n=1 Tax=Leguminivora glycinivorella TaxID=1035111 RepID=UPI00200CCC5B|nr:microtubule-associated protein tau isoform X2 [Leguminivora glycinivorella]
METNNAIRAQTENRPLVSGVAGPEAPVPAQFPPRPPLNRADSRSAFPQPSLRPAAPAQPQQRPQFQPGGPVAGPPQFAPRPGPLPPRGAAPPGPQQIRPQQPLRPSGPQSFAPQLGPRPVQSPAPAQPSPRGLPPTNLQFGPRPTPQVAGAITPDGARPPPQLPQQSNNGIPKNGTFQNPASGPLSRQSSQGSLKGLDISHSIQNKSANLDNQSIITNPNDSNQENGSDALAPKGRSYSIAAAPGAPSPLKVEDDRRKSVSSIGGTALEYSSRSPGLGLIQEGKFDSHENVRSSVGNMKPGLANDPKDMIERPESRISGSKMTDSFIGSLPTAMPKKKLDDDDDVVLQNNTSAKNVSENVTSQSKFDPFDRSPSLTRSDDSPELKQKTSPSPVISNKSQSITPEPQRPKTPKVETKSEARYEQSREVKPGAVTPAPKTKSPILDTKPPLAVHKPTELNMNTAAPDYKKTVTPKRTVSAPKSRPKDGDNDSGVDESTQGNDLNGSPGSPNKKNVSKLPTKEKSSSSLKPSLSRSSSKSATVKIPETPQATEKKKVPMNKVQVGNAPSPNIKTVKSKIGSLDNATYKPGGGKVKIENRKLEFKAAPRIAAKNETYTPSGGTKKITTTKLEWNAKSKIGSLDNTAYKPGGGDKKIETVKLDFKDKAKPKVASTVNITHKPGGGAVKIENQKLEFKAQSKVGSMDNVKHKPGGGDIKIFDDKDYIKQTSGQSPLPSSHTHSRQESPVPPAAQTPKSDENLNQQQC